MLNKSRSRRRFSEREEPDVVGATRDQRGSGPGHGHRRCPLFGARDNRVFSAPCPRKYTKSGFFHSNIAPCGQKLNSTGTVPCTCARCTYILNVLGTLSHDQRCTRSYVFNTKFSLGRLFLPGYTNVLTYYSRSAWELIQKCVNFMVY